MFPALAAWDPAPLRRALERGAYTQATLKQLDLGGMAFQGRAAALFRESLPPGSPLKALARLFMLGDAVPVADLLGTLGPELGPLAELGVLSLADGHARSHINLIPYGDGWFACDFTRLLATAPADYVMGLSPVTRLMAALTPRQQTGSFLELGCGGGWLSLQAHRGGITTTGTDISPRAIAIARFNEKLAGSRGIEWRQGSWFEPVAGRRFDRICCNPPYVQSPGGPQTFCETTSGSEQPCAHILRHIAEHLNPGGIACVLLNWSHHGTDDWTEAPLAWAPATGVRRWLFQLESQNPVRYAWHWIRPDPRFPDETSTAIEMDRWLAHHAAARTSAISSGFIVLQRCEPGQEWTRTDSRATGELPPNAHEEVARILANESWLQQGPDTSDLLEARYLVPDGIRAEIVTSLGDHGWQDRTIRLSSPGRLSYDGQIDENLMRLLELCRKGQRPADMVAELRTRPQFRETADLEARIAGLTRELIRFALVTPT